MKCFYKCENITELNFCIKLFIPDGYFPDDTSNFPIYFENNKYITDYFDSKNLKMPHIKRILDNNKIIIAKNLIRKLKLDRINKI